MVNSKNAATRAGFTVIEVMFFIGISGMLLAGVLVGSSASIARQRYKDSVQDFAEFVRRTYSSVLNVEAQRKGPLYSNDICNINSQEDIRKLPLSGSKIDELYGGIVKGLPGRTNCAYYGKLVTFNETDEKFYDGEGYKIRVYDIIGKIKDPDVNNYKTTMDAMLGRKKVSQTDEFSFDNTQAILPESLIVTPDKDRSYCKVEPASMNEYRMQWGAFLETAETKRKAFKGSLAIIRSPETNQIQTFYSTETLRISDYLNDGAINKNTSCAGFESNSYEKYSLTKAFKEDKFIEDENGVDFCINSKDGLLVGQPRRRLHIGYRASNSSAIDLVAEDKDGKCNK